MSDNLVRFSVKQDRPPLVGEGGMVMLSDDPKAVAVLPYSGGKIVISHKDFYVFREEISARRHGAARFIVVNAPDLETAESVALFWERKRGRQTDKPVLFSPNDLQKLNRDLFSHAVFLPHDHISKIFIFNVMPEPLAEYLRKRFKPQGSALTPLPGPTLT
jgi:hypothetical protein